MPDRRRARARIRVGGRALAAATLAVGLAAGGGAVAEPARASTDAHPAASASPAAPAVVDLGVADAVALLDAGSTTSVELTRAYLARIDAYDDDAGDDEPGLQAVITTNPDALATAATLDAERAAGTIRGPLHGVPIVVKDNHATADMPTTVGSAALRDYRTTADSTAVARLRAAGAIILAKTNMSEFAWHGTYTLGSARGRTANPYDRSWSASGSSGARRRRSRPRTRRRASARTRADPSWGRPRTSRSWASGRRWASRARPASCRCRPGRTSPGR